VYSWSAGSKRNAAVDNKQCRLAEFVEALTTYLFVPGPTTISAKLGDAVDSPLECNYT
jgi:hypothetical protein